MPNGSVGSVDEERGRAESREVRDPKLSGPARRVEGIGEQEERPRHGRLLRGEEARLTAAVGMAAEPDAPGGRCARAPPRRPGARRGRARRRPGDGGPCGRAWRNGRSQRSTATPRVASASASATRSGLSEDEPAPWVRTRPSDGGARRGRGASRGRPAPRRPPRGTAMGAGRGGSGVAHRPDPGAREPGGPARDEGGQGDGSRVFFDVAGTLIRVRDGVGAQYARVAGALRRRRRPEGARARVSRAPSGPRRRWRSPARRPRRSPASSARSGAASCATSSRAPASWPLRPRRVRRVLRRGLPALRGPGDVGRLPGRDAGALRPPRARLPARHRQQLRQPRAADPGRPGPRAAGSPR